MAVNTLTLSHTGGRQSPEYTRYIGNDKLLTITDTPLAPLVSSTTIVYVLTVTSFSYKI